MIISLRSTDPSVEGEMPKENGSKAEMVPKEGDEVQDQGLCLLFFY